MSEGQTLLMWWICSVPDVLLTVLRSEDDLQADEILQVDEILHPGESLRAALRGGLNFTQRLTTRCTLTRQCRWRHTIAGRAADAPANLY